MQSTYNGRELLWETPQRIPALAALQEGGESDVSGSNVRSARLRRTCLCTVFVLLFALGCRTQPSSDAGFLERPTPRHIRVMSFNPVWDSIFPDDDPQNDGYRRDSKAAEFVRIIQAIEPDVICLQEIRPARDPQQVARILDAALPLAEGRTWQAHNGADNVIAARYALRMPARAATQRGHAMALVDLPDADYVQDLYLVCAHLPSGGGQTNVDARQRHADAIAAWVGDARTPGGEVDLPANTPIVVLGDFNVYDTDPAHHLTTLLSGDISEEQTYGPDIAPDWDATSLADALPSHNAEGKETYTWRDDTQRFNPGVLDRILYTDSVLTVEHAFVLNSMSMSKAGLRAAGLEAGDVTLNAQSGRYDHLPLVADLSLTP